MRPHIKACAGVGLKKVLQVTDRYVTSGLKYSMDPLQLFLSINLVCDYQDSKYGYAGDY